MTPFEFAQLVERLRKTERRIADVWGMRMTSTACDREMNALTKRRRALRAEVDKALMLYAPAWEGICTG